MSKSVCSFPWKACNSVSISLDHLFNTCWVSDLVCFN